MFLEGIAVRNDRPGCTWSSDFQTLRQPQQTSPKTDCADWAYQRSEAYQTSTSEPTRTADATVSIST